MMIADRPDSAYEICSRYAPNCSGGRSLPIEAMRLAASSQREARNQSTSSAAIEQKSLPKSRSSSSRRLNDPPASSANGYNAIRSFRNEAANGRGNSDANLISRDDSGESDGLGGVGVGFNSEDDYYDSLNSGDENELPVSRPIPSTTSKPFVEVYNPEPGIDDNVFNGSQDPGSYENERAAAPVSNATTFSTIVNGVKIKSLPGPRGK